MMTAFDPLENNNINNSNINNNAPCRLSYPQIAGMVSFVLLLVVTYVTQVDTTPNPDQQSHSVVNKYDTLLRTSPTKRDGLGIVWLMSFPNSGTSFTSKLIRHVTQSSTASNYGEEVPHMDSVFDGSGPFWLDPQSLKSNHTRPTNLVFTKTHCGGRCELCGPSVSTESPQSFLVQCLSGHDPKGKAVRYSNTKVKKALHLMRNPFDNIVSRFHLELHSFAKKKDKVQYTKDRDGFRKFCKHVMDDPHAHEFKTSRLIDADVFGILKDVPCRADFMRYVQWHNLAHIVTQHHLGIPTMVLHYEDYQADLEGTTAQLLHFLEMPKRGKAVDFVAGKEYAKEYFTKEERAAVQVATQRLSLLETWEQLHHYFEE